MKYIKLFENFMDKHKFEYKAVQNQEGKWEIHIKNTNDNDFNLPTSGSLWTNDGKYYSSEGSANTAINNLVQSLDDEDDEESGFQEMI